MAALRGMGALGAVVVAVVAVEVAEMELELMARVVVGLAVVAMVAMVAVVAAVAAAAMVGKAEACQGKNRKHFLVASPSPPSNVSRVIGQTHRGSHRQRLPPVDLSLRGSPPPSTSS